jgi:hypothetical protein
VAVAIVTKYLGPTNYRGARIRASVPSRIADCDPERAAEYPNHRPGYWRLTISYPDCPNSEDAHRVAAEALRDRLGWTGTLHAGALDTGYAFTFGPGPDDGAPWTVEAGRTLRAADGTAVEIARETDNPPSPHQTDELARRIAAALNR